MPDDLHFTANTGIGATQIADARLAWIEGGLDADAFDRAISGAPAPAPDKNDTVSDLPVQGTQWSDQQAREIVLEQRARGVSDDVLRLHLRADGFSEEQAAALLAPVPADTRSDDQKIFDAAGLGAAKASDYRQIDWYGRLSPEADIHATNEGARDFLVAIGAPAVLGPSLIEDAMDAGKAYLALPESQIGLYHQTEDQRLRELLGSDRAGEVNGKIMALLKDAPKPFVAMLVDTGALRSANVRFQLANIADMQKLNVGVKAGASLDSLLSAR